MDQEESARNKISKTTSKYWEGRLFKRTYKGAGGEKILAPDWYVTLCYKGKDSSVCMQTPNKAAAAKRALDAYLLLKSQGWDALWDVYKVRKSKNDGKKKGEISGQKIITIGDFISALNEKYTFQKIPRTPTISIRYIGLHAIFLAYSREEKNMPIEMAKTR
jgi:hypothetical protein